MKLLKSYILVSLVAVSSAFATDTGLPSADDQSILFPEISKIMEVANSKQVGQRVSYLISNILNEAMRTKDESTDLGRNIMVAEQILSPAYLPQLAEKIKTDPLVLDALSKSKTDSYSSGNSSVEALPMNRKFNYQCPNINGQYEDRTTNPDYISDLRNKRNLVGVHLTAPGKTMALRQVGQNLFQFVVINTGTFGMPDVLTEISGEFTKEQLNDISNQTKAEVSNTKGKVGMQPGLNLTNTAVSVFVSSGSPAALVAAGPSFVIDAITSPFQLSIWAWKKAQLKLKGRALNKKADVSSNDVLRITTEQMFQLHAAIATVQPVTQMNKCIRVYRGF